MINEKPSILASTIECSTILNDKPTIRGKLFDVLIYSLYQAMATKAKQRMVKSTGYSRDTKHAMNGTHLIFAYLDVIVPKSMGFFTKVK